MTADPLALLPTQLNQVLQCYQAGDNAAAERLGRELIHRYPNQAPPLALLGHILHRLGRDEEAQDLLSQAHKISPALPQPWVDLAGIALRRGDGITAERAAREAVKLAPSGPANFVLAQALFLQRRYSEAEALFDAVAQSDARSADVRFQLALQCYERREFSEASKHFQACTRWRPNWVEAWVNLGVAHADQGEHTAAVEALKHACTLAPENVNAIERLITVMENGNAATPEILAVRQRLIALRPDVWEFQLGLGLSLVKAQQYREAKRAFEKVIALSPDNLAARWMSFQLPDQAAHPNLEAMVEYRKNWERGIDYFESLDYSTPEITKQAQAVLSTTTNFYLAYLGEPLLDLHRRHAHVVRRLMLAACPGITEVAAGRIGSKRRRIGIVSSLLYGHVVSKVWSQALLGLDRAEFELLVFYLDANEDDSTARWRDRADVYLSGSRDVRFWVSAIHEAKLDVAIFLDIGMGQYQQALAALRFAPVQVTTWAHPVTSGMDSIDYFLSADACEPDNAQDHYSEVLIRLPRLGTTLVKPAEVPQRAVFNTEAAVQFFCLQSIAKLNPKNDELFVRVAIACPQARLHFLTSAVSESIAQEFERRLREAFDKHKLDFDSRCQVYKSLPMAEYFAKLTQADAILDTLDFSGGITTLDALWHDLPVVTLPGPLMRGRQSYAMLKLIGLDELIAADYDDYVRIATRLATDPTWRGELSARIRSHKAQLYEDASVGIALADFLRQVEPPGHSAQASHQG